VKKPGGGREEIEEEEEKEKSRTDSIGRISLC